MASDYNKTLEPSSPSPSGDWKERIGIPTLLAGAVGAGVGLLSKHSKVHGVAQMSASYAANFAIVTGCYCGAREFVRASRHSDDFLNSAIGGFSAGALLGRLQGGKMGAIRYSLIFAVVGTTVDYAAPKLRPLLKSFGQSIFKESDGSHEKNGSHKNDGSRKSDGSYKNDGSHKNDGWLKLPEWSPIQVLDEEALAKREAQKQKLAQSTLQILEKEKS